MKKPKLLFAIFLSVCALPLSADVQQYEDQLASLSSQIKDGLIRSRQKIESLSESLTALRGSLTVSEGRRAELETIYSEACTSLSNTNKLLQDSYANIEKYKEQVRVRNKAILWLGIICAAFIVLKVIVIILRVKSRVILPWIIDVLV